MICHDDGLVFPGFEVKSWSCNDASATFCKTDNCKSSFYGGVPGQETSNDDVSGLGIVAVQVKKEVERFVPVETLGFFDYHWQLFTSENCTGMSTWLPERLDGSTIYNWRILAENYLGFPDIQEFYSFAPPLVKRGDVKITFKDGDGNPLEYYTTDGSKEIES